MERSVEVVGGKHPSTYSSSPALILSLELHFPLNIECAILYTIDIYCLTLRPIIVFPWFLPIQSGPSFTPQQYHLWQMGWNWKWHRWRWVWGNVGEDVGDKTRRFNIYDNVNTELNGPTCWCNHGAEGKAGGVEMRKGRCWQQQWSGTGMMHIDPSGTHMLTFPVFFS